MKKIFINKLYRKVSILLIASMMINTVPAYALKHEPEFPSSPSSGDEGEGVSQGVIYSKQKTLKPISPTNPNPSVIDEEEKKLYDNYVIDLNTIDKRVEYFSPTYVYALSMAQNTVLGQMASMGVSPVSSQDITDAINDLKWTKQEVKDGIKQAREGLNTLINTLKKDPTIDIDKYPDVVKVRSQIEGLKENEQKLDDGISGYVGVRAKFNYNLKMIQDAAKIAGLSYTKDLLTKGMVSALLGYLQLHYYEELLLKQVEMYDRLYKLTIKTKELGQSTDNDVVSAKLILDTTIDSYNSVKAQKDSVEDQLLVNLGYDLSDKNKIMYMDPSIDFISILSIDPKNDYEHAYNSNQVYKTVYNEVQKMKNRGDDYSMNIYERYRGEYRQKIMSMVDDYYAKLKYAFDVYQSTLPLFYAYEMDLKNAENLKKQGLVSEAEAIGLDVKNLATQLELIQAKYNLITAYYNYHYAVYGVGTL